MRKVLALYLFAVAAPLAASIPGVGYQPLSRTTQYRAIPGGPVLRATGAAEPNPWRVACAGSLPCIQAWQFYPDDAPGAHAAYCTHYGVCLDQIRGGWAGGLSSENAKRLPEALKFWFQTNPSRLRSPGAAGGFDGIPTGTEVTDALAFGEAKALFNEYCRATRSCDAEGGGEQPPSTCAPPKVCIEPPVPCPPSCLPPKACLEPCPACPECPPACALPKVCIEPPQPTCIPARVRATACSCEVWTKVGWRKTRCREACAWAKTLPLCPEP